MSKKKPRPKLAKCHLATGSAVAGGVLYALLYWNNTREFDGKGCFAKPRKEVVHESGFSMEQVKDGLSILRKIRFIETSQHMFGNKNVMHVHITNECRKALENVDATRVEADASAKVVGNASARVGANGSTLKIQRQTTKTNNKDKQHSDRINPIAKNVSGFEQDSEENQQCETNEKNACASAPENEEAMSKHSKSVYDVVAGKKSNMLLHSPKSANALGKLWLSVFKEVHGPTAQNLTNAQYGMLKKVINACPPEEAPQIVEKVIREWYLFTQHAKVNAAAYPIPGQPTIEFLLKYVGFAVSFAPSPNHKQEAPVFVSKKVEPLQSIASWKKPSLAHPETGSLEEALAIFNDDTDVN